MCAWFRKSFYCKKEEAPVVGSRVISLHNTYHAIDVQIFAAIFAGFSAVFVYGKFLLEIPIDMPNFGWIVFILGLFIVSLIALFFSYYLSIRSLKNTTKNLFQYSDIWGMISVGLVVTAYIVLFGYFLRNFSSLQQDIKIQKQQECNQTKPD